MKRLCCVLIALILIFSFCGCEKNDTKTVGNDIGLVVMPDEETAATVNGYKTENSSAAEGGQTDNSAYSYYANVSSKKFHLSSCSYAKQINEENLKRTNNRDELVSSGFTACKKCNP